MRWAIKHKSCRTLFVTSDEFIANNRRKMGWIVEEVKMTSREQFELWVSGTTNSDFHRSIMLCRHENGNYNHLETNHKWEAWQASRAAIEIELPNQFPGEYYLDRDVIYADELIEELEQAGLKVKK
jgi:hypothetical protein|nr:MAG TPA: hypothetical protein [Caudoviricetes sp.]